MKMFLIVLVNDNNPDKNVMQNMLIHEHVQHVNHIKAGPGRALAV